MRNWDAEIKPLKRLSPGLESVADGGKTIVLLPTLQFEARGKQVTRDALLWPHDRDGYTSRLFLSDKAPASQELNWNLTFHLLKREWHTWSWRDVPNTQPLISILAGHLEAFR